jgi:Fic family protein
VTTAYRPFPDVKDWPRDGVDFVEVDRVKAVSDRLAGTDQRLLSRARETVKRLAAIETGKIEQLYDLERGVTMTAALDGAVLEAAFKDKGKAHALIEGQLAAYDNVLDLATGARPIAEAWIRELHSILCAAQDTYSAIDGQGVAREVELKKGEYKANDNHVKTAKGVHYYAPAIDVAAEMARYVANVSSEEFSHLHLVDQAAYAHFSFVAIHPFADGNGRVARALTSIPTFRTLRVPILITADHRDMYFDSLAAADEGRFDAFRLFLRNRLIESVLFLERSVSRAKGGTPKEIVSRISQNFVTRGGFSHIAIDEAGSRLLEVLEGALNKVVGDPIHRPPGVDWSVGTTTSPRRVESPDHRRVLASPEKMVVFAGFSKPPAEASFAVNIGVEVPSDALAEDFFVLECGPEQRTPRLELLVRDVIPKLSLIAEMNILLLAEDVLDLVGSEVSRLGREKLKLRGYLRN